MNAPQPAEKAVDAVVRRIVDDLRRKILEGEWPHGHRLPSLAVLAKEYGTHRGVPERAFTILRAEGIIVTRQGAGAFVDLFERVSRYSPQRMTPTDRAIQDHDTGARPRLAEVKTGAVSGADLPEWVAEALRIGPGEEAMKRVRRYLIDGRPVQIATSWLPRTITMGSAIEHTETGPGGIYGILAGLGFPLTRCTERLVVRGPNQLEEEALDLPPIGRVAQVRRWAYAGDRCVEVNQMTLAGFAYEFIYDFPVPDGTWGPFTPPD